MPNPISQRLDGLQVLRLFAAFAVLLERPLRRRLNRAPESVARRPAVATATSK